MCLRSAGSGAGAGWSRMALDGMLRVFVHSLADEPGLVLQTEQGFVGGSRNMQMLFEASACILVAAISLAKVSDTATLRVRIEGPLKEEGSREAAKIGASKAINLPRALSGPVTY